MQPPYRWAPVLVALSLAIETVCLLSQTAPSPTPAGNTALLTWSPNDPNEGVTNDNVYATSGTSLWVRASASNAIPLSTLLPGNGTYTLSVTACNVNGESIHSTNLLVRYWANKPSPPQGLASR